MRQLKILGFCLSFITLIMPFLAHAQQVGGVSVTCENGAQFDNGVEVVINQMRSGFTYRATAIGINGFDPVLAVLDSSRNGLCNDDDATASGYSLNLPTTGIVGTSNLSAQVTFDQNSASTFADISLVVGGYGNTTGEFVLILEGMGVTSGDGVGDTYSLRVTPQMVASGNPLTAYMISRVNTLDPLLYRADTTGDVLADNAGNAIGCDDAGNTNLCWGQSVSLNGAYVVTGNGQVNGNDFDALLNIPLANVSLNNDPDSNFMNFVATSYQQNTTGQYILAFHISLGGGTGTNTQPTAQPTQRSQSSNTNVGGGVSVTCDDGTAFNNGVEVRVIQMRAGFTYTATAVGLNGFDPVLAVLDSAGRGLCNDDNAQASRYTFNLPTTSGSITSNRSAQVQFAQTSGRDFADISLVVGGYGDATGEFVLILEGMGVTAADGAGDPFAVQINPLMINSGVPLTTYMLAASTTLDPLMYLRTNGQVTTDANNNAIVCDDAGNTARCYGQSFSLSNSSVSTLNGNLSGKQLDAMLQLDIVGTTLNANPEDNFLHFVMTSYEQTTLGQYVIAFHIGISD